MYWLYGLSSAEILVELARPNVDRSMSIGNNMPDAFTAEVIEAIRSKDITGRYRVLIHFQQEPSHSSHNHL